MTSPYCQLPTSLSHTHSLLDETVVEESEEHEPTNSSPVLGLNATPLVAVHAPSLENLQRADEIVSEATAGNHRSDENVSEATAGNNHRSQLMKQRSLNGFLVSESQRGAMERQSSV